MVEQVLIFFLRLFRSEISLIKGMMDGGGGGVPSHRCLIEEISIIAMLMERVAYAVRQEETSRGPRYQVLGHHSGHTCLRDPSVMLAK